MSDKCPGCDPDIEDGDHYHQFINFFGDAASVWYIDGKTFRDLSAVSVYLEETLDCDAIEAMDFIRTLKKKYN